MMKRLVWADEQGNVLSVWREAFGIIRRYPLASGFPAAVLGMLGAAPYYFIEGKIHVREEILTSLTAAFAFYLYIVYVAYAEQVTAQAERGVQRITTRGMLHMLWQASLVAPSAMAAAVAAIIIPRATTVLLVIPGLWILTRWSLFAPVTSREHLGPVAALKRSNEVVRGHFELVFLTATFAAVLEEVAVHAGGVVGLRVLGLRHMGSVARQFDCYRTDHAVGSLRNFSNVHTSDDAYPFSARLDIGTLPDVLGRGALRPSPKA